MVLQICAQVELATTLSAQRERSRITKVGFSSSVLLRIGGLTLGLDLTKSLVERRFSKTGMLDLPYRVVGKEVHCLTHPFSIQFNSFTLRQSVGFHHDGLIAGPRDVEAELVVLSLLCIFGNQSAVGMSAKVSLQPEVPGR